MKTSSVFKYCIVPFIIFCCLMIVPIETTDAQFAVPVTAGWNMIGSLCNGAPSEIITTIPEGILASDFFGYQGSYNQPDELKKGFGYWVKVSAPGLIIFNCSGVWACGDPVYDYYELKQYNTLQIGGQCWLKENMNTGIRIDGDQDQEENSAIEKYCYGNDPANCTLYGALYQWGEAMQYTPIERTRGICPPGSHIPTLDEFQTLKDYVSSDVNALMSVGQGEGTNSSGFSGLFSGIWDFDQIAFDQLSNHTGFWSSTVYLSGGYSMYLTGSGSFFLTGSDERYGFSVRCIKD